MSVENLSEEKDWNMLGTLKSLKAVLDDLMEQEGDWDKIYNHFGYMAENETEAKKKEINQIYDYTKYKREGRNLR